MDALQASEQPAPSTATKVLVQRMWRSEGCAAAVAALLLLFMAVAAADALSEFFNRVFPRLLLGLQYNLVQKHRKAAVHNWQTRDGRAKETSVQTGRPVQLCYNVSLAWEVAFFVHCDSQ